MVNVKVHEASEVLTVAKVSVAVLALLASSFIADADSNSCTECFKADQVCCSGSCVLGSSCLGLSCSSDLDCLSGESCCSNTCVNGSNCVGQNCSSHSDCGSDESCCRDRKYGPKKCKSGDSCDGLSCFSDGDCAAGETCCDNECVSYHCTAVVMSMVILIPVAGTILISFVCVYLGEKCIKFYYRIDGSWTSACVLRPARQRETTIRGTSPRYSSPHLSRSSPSTTEQTDLGYTTAAYEQILLVQLTELPPPSASAQTEVTAQSDSPYLGQSPYDQSSSSYSPPPYEQIPPMEPSVPPPPDTPAQAEVDVLSNLSQSPPPYDQSFPSHSVSPPPYEQILPIEANRPLPPPPGASAHTEEAGQSNSPLQGQTPPPPPYDQSPPIELSEPPPPYSEVPEERSGGASASQNIHQGTQPRMYAVIVYV